jgi:hypothetical protein
VRLIVWTVVGFKNKKWERLMVQFEACTQTAGLYPVSHCLLLLCVNIKLSFLISLVAVHFVSYTV